MPSSVIQWFPGHMAKTKRLITECLPLVDIVIEVLDARIPVSSKNPVLDSLLGQKPRLAVFSKSALADPGSEPSLAGVLPRKRNRDHILRLPER